MVIISISGIFMSVYFARVSRGVLHSYGIVCIVLDGFTFNKREATNTCLGYILFITWLLYI
jgi:hypothetical protein